MQKFPLKPPKTQMNFLVDQRNLEIMKNSPPASIRAIRRQAELYSRHTTADKRSEDTSLGAGAADQVL